MLDEGVSKREEARMMLRFLVRATRRRTMSVWMKEAVGEVGFGGGWHQEFCFGVSHLRCLVDIHVSGKQLNT